MLFILLNETKSLLNTKKMLWAAILDHVWHQNYFFPLFSRLHDQTLYQCHARQQEVAKGSNICLWCKMLNENVIDLDQMSKVIYPDISLWRYAKAAKKGGKEETDFVSHFCPSHVPLRFVTSHSLCVPRVSRSPLCEKRSVWGEGNG